MALNTQTVIDEYLDEIKDGVSVSTLNTYSSVLNNFAKEIPFLDELTSDSFFVFFKKNYENKKPATLKLCLSILGNLFKMCVSKRYILKSPMKSYYRVSKSRSTPKCLERL